MLENLYKIIQGEDIFQIPEDTKEVIVEGMLHRGDYVTLIAEEKVGKTILAQQLTCNLTTGTPFLGILDIPKPQNVWYFATEGRSGDLQDRFIRMNKEVPLNTDNLLLIPSLFKFNTEQGMDCLQQIMDSNPRKPDVLFIDSLYSGFAGSLKEDKDVNEFNTVVRWIQSKLGCAVIPNHHMKKNSKDQNGNYYKRSDKDSYGSAFLSAAVDHVFWLEKWRDKKFPKDRILKCDTQRGGDIIDSIRIRLEEPDPLYFYRVDVHTTEKIQVLDKLSGNIDGFSASDLIKQTKIGKTTMYTILKELTMDNTIIKQPIGLRNKHHYKLTEFA